VIRLLIWLVLIYVGYKIVQGFMKTREPKETPLPMQGEETHRDPVCGVYVAKDDAVIGNHEGERIYFCSMVCLEKYQEQLTLKQ
jgi:YHS domain-containing protein